MSKFDMRDENFLTTSRKSMKLYRKMSIEGIKDFDFTPNETDVIIFLLNNPGLNTSTDISNCRGISKALVCKAVEQLCKKGYLSTTVNEKDRRIVHLKLEEKANIVTQLLEEARQSFFAILYDGISDEDLETLSKITQKIAENVNVQND